MGFLKDLADLASNNNDMLGDFLGDVPVVGEAVKAASYVNGKYYDAVGNLLSNPNSTPVNVSNPNIKDNEQRARVEVYSKIFTQAIQDGYAPNEAKKMAQDYLKTNEGKSKIAEVLAQLNAGNSTQGKAVENILDTVKTTAKDAATGFFGSLGEGLLNKGKDLLGKATDTLKGTLGNVLGNTGANLIDTSLTEFFKKNWWKIILFGLVPLGTVIYIVIKLASNGGKPKKGKRFS
ncbi:hypothetical protein [Flavobacterium coralii]|uniref:hypothetical protein n=1 Tax=Flavobacterium coralii TaxID=2838017 RepID=UPI000C5390AA|nr:hypothetical protein [Flavobacterium sp.]|tara:strand:+ start:40974 stop:41675 length:702 start_codon:yes stop_codon:yes gene_type:complete